MPVNADSSIRNPFNGIERLEDRGLIECMGEKPNPFNGIERYVVYRGHHALYAQRGIHSMELKDTQFTSQKGRLLERIHSMELKDTQFTSQKGRLLERIHSMELKGGTRGIGL